MTRLLEEKGRKCGEQRLCVTFEQFGRREIKDLLRMWSFLFKD